MTKILPNKLLVSEKFYSIQGEGKTTGVPAYFIRLANCNLQCGSSIKFLNSIKKGLVIPDPSKPFVGDLEEAGEATWSCDSTAVWLKGNYVEFQEIIDDWMRLGIYDDIENGIVHIIWTGGEPTILQHQQSIYNFNEYWKDMVSLEQDSPFPKMSPFQEIETNGTNLLIDDLYGVINQVNCSPKLSNSGMSVKQRINPDVIRQFNTFWDTQFKFVVSTEDDIIEMFNDFIIPLAISLQDVVCMPALTSQKDFFERTKWIMEMAKKYKFIGMTRNHVAAWNELTGV